MRGRNQLRIVNMLFRQVTVIAADLISFKYWHTCDWFHCAC